jgi:hypothetical protein
MQNPFRPRTLQNPDPSNKKTIKVTDRNRKNGYPTGFNAVKGKTGLGWWGISREV